MSDADPTQDVDPDPSRDGARDALDHLQAAARELIAAARAALDVAEGLVDDPEVVASVAGTAGRIGHVLRAFAGERAAAWVTSDGETGDPAAGSQVERIIID
jgi:hypothetical protein